MSKTKDIQRRWRTRQVKRKAIPINQLAQDRLVVANQWWRIGLIKSLAMKEPSWRLLFVIWPLTRVRIEIHSLIPSIPGTFVIYLQAIGWAIGWSSDGMWKRNKLFGCVWFNRYEIQDLDQRFIWGAVSLCQRADFGVGHGHWARGEDESRTRAVSAGRVGWSVLGRNMVDFQWFSIHIHNINPVINLVFKKT